MSIDRLTDGSGLQAFPPAEKWDDWREYDMEVTGSVWLIKSDRSMNKKAAESLASCGGWNGTFASIEGKSWKPTPVGFSTEEHIYREQVSYRLRFLNTHSYTPGSKAQAISAACSLSR